MNERLTSGFGFCMGGEISLHQTFAKLSCPIKLENTTQVKSQNEFHILLTQWATRHLKVVAPLLLNSYAHKPSIILLSFL